MRTETAVRQDQIPTLSFSAFDIFSPTQGREI